MAAVIKFTATKLEKSGKKGVLKPDQDGCYTTVIGALNAFNSVGEYYTIEGARDLFEKSGILMRRIQNGCLKGEVGHPKQAPGMDFNQYVNRVMTIEETNVCCQFVEVWLDPEYGRTHPEFKNQNMIAIMARVRPTGPHGEMLRKAFENAGENVCFSIRALTKDYYERGQNYRVLSTIVAWDYVTEPGLAACTKFNSPALESLNESYVTRECLQSIVDDKQTGVAIESTKLLIKECLSSIDHQASKLKQPRYATW